MQETANRGVTAYWRRPSSRPCQRLDEVGGLAQRPVEDRRRVDGGVVGDPVHHHLADDRADPVRLGRAERRIEARLVDRAVDQRRRRAGRRERPPGERREAGRLGLVEAALEREDVALEPGQQVQPGAEAGVGELRQVGVQVDQPGQQHPRPEVEGGVGLGGPVGGGPGEGQAPGGVDDQQAVGLVARAARRRGASAGARGSRTAGSREATSGPPRKASRACSPARVGP